MFIQPSHPALQYMGRIDTANPNQPIWVYPYTQVSFRTTGTSLRIQCINRWNYGENYVGAVIDGMQVKVRIPENDVPVTLVLAEFLPMLNMTSLFLSVKTANTILKYSALK